jgi:V8-like Glu-specific endopeptidase
MLRVSMLRITHIRGRMAPAVEHFAVARVRAGSAPGSELCFGARDGRGVEPRHAEIRVEAGVVYVIDQGSRAGTFVNGAPVRRQALRNGDRVAVGGADGPEFRVELLAQQAGPDADGRVDLATAERIVRGWGARWAGPPPAPPPATVDKTPSIVATKVAAAQKRSGRTNALLTAGLLAVLVALVATAGSIWQSHRAASALGDDIGIDKRPVKRPTGEIPTRVMSGREIYDLNKSALYVVGWKRGNTYGGVCSAFAIRSDLLATNAHCVAAIRNKRGAAIVTQNDSGGRVRYRILAAKMHPKYKGGTGSADSPDVGLIRVDGRMPRTVTLANDAELRALGPGDDVFVLGFPGRVMDPISPTATFLKGHIGRLMALGENAPKGVEDAVLVQHDAVTRGGNSGSPIFNQYGHVIGVHAAHIDEEKEVKVGGQTTTVVDSSPFRIGMRVDLIQGVRSP